MVARMRREVAGLGPCVWDGGFGRVGESDKGRPHAGIVVEWQAPSSAWKEPRVPFTAVLLLVVDFLNETNLIGSKRIGWFRQSSSAATACTDGSVRWINLFQVLLCQRQNESNAPSAYTGHSSIQAMRIHPGQSFYLHMHEMVKCLLRKDRMMLVRLA